MSTSPRKGSGRQSQAKTTPRGVPSPGSTTPLKADAQEFIPRPKQYSPFDADAPCAYRTAMDACYGMSFCGSMAFIGYKDEKVTVCKRVGAGPAKIERV